MQKKVIASPLAPKAVGPYSQAIAAGTTLYVSGQLPIDAATGLMAEGIEAQTPAEGIDSPRGGASTSVFRVRRLCETAFRRRRPKTEGARMQR